jgi:hypothetical protein
VAAEIALDRIEPSGKWLLLDTWRSDQEGISLMDIVKLLETQWAAISASPTSHIGIAVIAWLASMAFTRWWLGDEAAAAKERSQYYKDRIEELESQKNGLIKKLESHGEDINEIVHYLNSLPRISVGREEPRDPKKGDLWIDTSD